MEEDSLLRIERFSATYHTDQGILKAVNKVSLKIKKGEAVAIVGESGCGKSSLALGTMGLFKGKHVSVEGEIIFQNRNILDLSEKSLQTLRGRRIAMVFQDPMTSLNPYLKIGLQVEEQILRHLKCGHKEAKQRTIKMLEAVGLPNAAQQLGRYPHEFSGGMRQRTMLAAALSCSPDLLVADEPTTALDVTIQSQIIRLIQGELRKGKLSLLLITHDLGIVAGLCDRVFVMYAGEIVEEADVESIYANPRHPYTLALLKAIPRIDTDKPTKITPLVGQPPNMINFIKKGCVFGPRCSFVNDHCTNEIPLLRNDGRGHSYKCHYDLSFSGPNSTNSHDANIEKESLSPKDVKGKNNKCSSTILADMPGSSSNPILYVDGLVVQYNTKRRLNRRSCIESVRAVNGLSLQLYEGEILGLAGESGCGKSTLVRAILRLLEPSEGKIIFLGRDVVHLKGKNLSTMRRNIQLIFQDPYSSLNPRLKTWQIIVEPLINFKLLSGTKGLKSEAKRLMTIVGLNPLWSDRYPHEFSGGQRQRIGIARALAQQPKVLLCDEPVSALDVSVQAQILNLLKNLQNEFNLSLIFISHDLGVVRQISDRVAIMYMGRIIESADVNTIYSTPRHPYTQSLIKAIPIPSPLIEKKRYGRNSSDPSLDLSVVNHGCDFLPRCSWANHQCRESKPTLEANGSKHDVACFNWKDHG